MATPLVGAALSLLLLSRPVSAGSLKDIEHVVIFMQENRSWNSVCRLILDCASNSISTLALWLVSEGSMTQMSKSTMGCLSGISEYTQRSIATLTIWRQVDPDMSDKTETLLPWYLGYQGNHDGIQCMVAGSNGYRANHASLNDGLNNHWARNNTPWSWGYLKRNDIPVQFAIADGWTTGDMYQESQITATNPNRVTLVSGSVNVPGGPQTPDEGGVYLDNNETPGMLPCPL